MRTSLLAIFMLVSAIPAVPRSGKSQGGLKQQSSPSPSGVNFTSIQAFNLFAVSEILVEQFLAQAVHLSTASDTFLPILKGAEIMHQQVVDDGLFEQFDNCTFSKLGLLFSDDAEDLVASLIYLEDVMLMGTIALSSNPDLNFTDLEQDDVDDLFDTVSVIDTMVAASGGFPLRNTELFPDISISDLAQLLKAFQPNCPQDLGLTNLPLPAVQTWGFSTPFSSSASAPAVANVSNQCPTGTGCMCQAFTFDTSVPTQISPVERCILVGGPGVNLLYMTKDNTTLSRNSIERAAQIDVIAVGPTLIFGN